MGFVTRPEGQTPADYYFFLWNLTEDGVRNVDALKETIRRASAMVRDLRGKCNLYVTLGGRYDLVGVAQGVDDATATKILLGVNALGAKLGTIRTTTFFKARDFSVNEFDTFVDDVTRLLNLKP